MNLSLRRSTSALLASSLLLTIGRGATLPFMTIYLSRQYSLSVDLIGYAMTIALTIGVVFSLGFGILADRLCLYVQATMLQHRHNLRCLTAPLSIQAFQILAVTSGKDRLAKTQPIFTR